MTIAELLAQREKLQNARFKGVLSVMIDGEAMTYKSDQQMAAALASIEAEILKLTRGSRPRTIRPQTSRGL
ncbi:hypothetical protein KM176_17280 [Pseudooceanicola sp. CBS1P-1]|uniref:Uncharacterized protein n=1 Tax=Pseudooceanicola albus TaxID=2692189 RepID=A0A6L7G8F5_9RHOB|nr:MULTISPECIES: hypothetical protein [Pseudooceanicola]MBT9385627.1 hypothetical protein [Pseudooceanicola endophyticus]MXN18963.1 hypothetical protein [Pseudooceanicola albus]